MKNKLISYAKKMKIEICGFTQEENRSIFVALFPYYTGPMEDIGIARYAKLPDYHEICKKYLEKIGNYAKELDNNLSFELSVDREGNPERLWAKKAGLGFIGKNHCLVNPLYGSFVFIGALIFSKELSGEYCVPELSAPCESCGKCLTACPTGTLSNDDFSICLSRITQQKQLNETEHTILLKNPRIWGCDLCQNACPYNKNSQRSPFPEFYQNQLTTPEIFDGIEHLSNKEFREKYQTYPFTWRGKKVIERNLSLTRQK